MTKEDQEKMWSIKQRADFGHHVTDEEREFYNENLTEMVFEMEAQFDTWNGSVNL